MKASDYVADFLASQGVGQVFEVVGGMTTHLIDSLAARGGVRLVSLHHEQAAAFAADAAGRLKGVPGVAMATSGPGATNLLTGIGSCYFDSTPAVFITGQVNLAEQKGTRAIRQLGFQETDIVAVARPLTKAAWPVRRAAEIPGVLVDAFRTARSGRPGPVLVDIPFDLQRADLQAEPPRRVPIDAQPPADVSVLDALVCDLARAQRPLILAGGGLRAGQAIEPFRRFVDRVPVPVVHSLMAVDALAYAHPARVGMIGSYGNRWANIAISQADFVLVLGSRLDIRQTGADTRAFKGERRIYHIDCEAGEINNRVQGCEAIVADLATCLELLNERVSARGPVADWSRWRAELAGLRRAWPDTAELAGLAGINPNQLMHRLAAQLQDAVAYVADVGQHQMWAAQSLELGRDQRFITSGGMGAMGFALPAAIGVAIAAPGRPVVLIAGDGGFQLNIQELESVARNRLPIKMVVLDNRCLGMVRQFQETYFAERYESTYWGYSAPDFEAVARAYRIPSLRVDHDADLGPALERMAREPAEPFLLRVMIDTFANAYPKLAFGRPISEMEPLAKPIAMETT